MEPVTAMVGAWLGEWATVKVAEVLLGGVSCKLNANDLDKALKEATKAAQTKENELFLQGKGRRLKKLRNSQKFLSCLMWWRMCILVQVAN
jgi:hypothetical protein